MTYRKKKVFGSRAGLRPSRAQGREHESCSFAAEHRLVDQCAQLAPCGRTDSRHNLRPTGAGRGSGSWLRLPRALYSCAGEPSGAGGPRCLWDSQPRGRAYEGVANSRLTATELLLCVVYTTCVQRTLVLRQRRALLRQGRAASSKIRSKEKGGHRYTLARLAHGPRNSPSITVCAYLVHRPAKDYSIHFLQCSAAPILD